MNMASSLVCSVIFCICGCFGGTVAHHMIIKYKHGRTTSQNDHSSFPQAHPEEHLYEEVSSQTHKMENLDILGKAA